MCDEAIHIDPYLLEFVHHHFKTQKTCAEAEPYLLKFILDCSRSSKCLSKHYTKQYLLKSVLKEEILKYWKRTSDGRICFWQVQNTKSLVSKKPRNVFRSSRQKPYLLKSVSDPKRLQTRQCVSPLSKLFLSLTALRLKACALEQLRQTHGNCMLFLIVLKTQLMCDDVICDDSDSL